MIESIDIGKHEIPSDGLLIFLDETGHELFADPNYRVFGMGGCIVKACDYDQLIVQPWRETKWRWFGGNNHALHAADLRGISIEQMAAIGNVFSTIPFGRFATITSDQTILDIEDALMKEFGLWLMEGIYKVSTSYWPFSEVMMMFEASERLETFIERQFDGIQTFEVEVGSGSDVQNFSIPLIKCFADKTIGVDGLEIADFIVHTAGTQSRDRLARSSMARMRKDFELVFRSMPESLSYFMEVTRVRHQ